MADCAAARPAASDPPPEQEPPSAAPTSEGPTSEAPTSETVLPLVTLVQDKGTGGWGERLRRVVRDRETWEETWAELTPGRTASQPAPEVDFERFMVVAAALPTQHCDARITVREVRAVDGRLTVELLEELADPGLRCFVGTRPFHAVRLPRRPGEATFTAESRTYVAAPRTQPGTLPPNRP